MSRRNRYLFKFSSGERMEQYYCRALQCHMYLLDPCIVEYHGVNLANWNEVEIRNQNEIFDPMPKEGSGVVYMIHLRNNKKNSTWRRQYVGSSKAPEERIKQHLISCSKRTASRLDEVKEAVSHGKVVGISWIEIEPSFLRIGIEEMIIGLEKTTDKNALPWNGLPGERSKRGGTSGSSN